MVFKYDDLNYCHFKLSDYIEIPTIIRTYEISNIKDIQRIKDEKLRYELGKEKPLILIIVGFLNMLTLIIVNPLYVDMFML